jgi:hypothetical protein
VNGDGFPDIVTAGGTILFGDGKGGFPSRRGYALSSGISPGGSLSPATVMLGDFDGDGNIDIIVGIGSPDFFSSTVANPAAMVLFG